MEKPKSSVLDMILDTHATLSPKASVTLDPVIVEITNHMIGMSRRRVTLKERLTPVRKRTKGRPATTVRREIVYRALLYYTKALADYYKDDKLLSDPLVSEVAALLEDETILLDLEKPFDIL